MFRRATRMCFPHRVSLCVLAFAFAGTAVVQVFLATSMSEWWPLVLTVALALAALWCLVTAVTWNDHRRR